MVCLAARNLISPEARALIEAKAYWQDGLRQLAAVLPQDDAELDQWIRGAGEAFDHLGFTMLLFAAAIDGRRLQASLLPLARLMQVEAVPLGWIAWHMEGDVATEFLRALEEVPVGKDNAKAMALFVAAAWWQDHRAGEEMPRRIVRSAIHLRAEKGLDEISKTILKNLAVLLGDSDLAQRCGVTLRPATQSERRDLLSKIFGILNGPFADRVYARETKQYISARPMRRASPRIGRNERCHCGSGKKHKNCCEKKDHERLRNSSSVAGVTRDEMVPDNETLISEERLRGMQGAEILQVEPAQVPPEARELYLVSLTILKHYNKAVEALRFFGMGEELQDCWGNLFEHVANSWRPDIARQLMELFPDVRDVFPNLVNAAVRLLLVGDDPARLLAELENSIEALLKSGDLKELEDLTDMLVVSPYRGLGILLVRSLLPLAADDRVPELFEGILDARAKLDLPPNDEFSTWMDEQALHKARKHETAGTQEAQDKLEAKMEELRKAKENLARAQRELAGQRRRATEAESKSKVSASLPQESAREKELELKVAKLSAVVKEGNEEKLRLRRELQRTNKATPKETATAVEDKADDEDEGEDFAVEGNQPVRLLEFPKGFMETLASYPRHVGRATMNRLGRLASGEPAAFDRLKPLKAYPEVLRARVADKYRLLFCLLPNSVRVVDLIRRSDLDRRIERLRIGGLPPVA